ncbi:NAD(P)/FAD-dependent oxidoreductase [Lachnospiraceae bacterium NSJ-143]|nr:NAD(P)/FAD-dependent oxidoreductase [Lachnospiraceae bacterium NSJ-143]
MGRVIVVGAGPAGMIAAGRAAENGHEVHIFERNNIVGKKIYITGKGRCNVTNASDVDNFINNIPNNPYFLYSALYGFTSEDTVEFFDRLGVKTKVERGNRVFPVSDKAGDIAHALERYMKKNKVNIHLDSRVEKLIVSNSSVKGIKLLNGRQYYSDAVIVTTGGLSYPGTGSTGDGYKFAKDCGHNVTKLMPSLVPLCTEEKWCAELMGLSLKNISITVKNTDGKKLYEDFGEMLFTHFGVSGPVILSASCHITDMKGKKARLFIDLKPALDMKTLDLRILRDFDKFKNKNFINALDELLPKKLIPVIVRLSGIDGDKKVNEVTKEERKSLCSLIKALPLTITGDHGFGEAVITRGGINVDELNPSTMESKIISGLYFAGEVIDCDAYTGGYNLQIAFSTGFAAGNSVCMEE